MMKTTKGKFKIFYRFLIATLCFTFLLATPVNAGSIFNIFVASPEDNISEESYSEIVNDNPLTGLPFNPLSINVGSHVITPTDADIRIEVVTPALTNKPSAAVALNISPTPKEVYYRLSEKDEWKDITVISQVQITNDTFIYIKVVTDTDKTITAQSEYIECFDRQAPTFTTAFQSDDKVTITSKDNLAGVKALYINDTVIYEDDFRSSSDDGKLITYVHTMRNANSIVIQAEDKVGNISRTEVVEAKKTSSNNATTTPTTDSGKIGNAKINIIPPSWTNQKDALVKVEVDGKNIDTVQAKIGREGQWFTVGETMDFVIKANCEVYVRTTDTEGKETVTSATIFCFDYNAPTVKAVQDGSDINITTEDNLSGVAYVYVNGRPYVPDAAGGFSVPVADKTSFVIQAKDQANNMSKTLTIAPDGTSSSRREETPYNEQETGKVFYVTIGGDSYTIEQLQKLGLPIYIFPEADEETIKAILYARGDEIYMDNTGIVLDRHMLYKEAYDENGNRFWVDRKGNFVLFDKEGKPVIWNGDWASRDWYDIDGNLIKVDEQGIQEGNAFTLTTETEENNIVDANSEKSSKSVKNIIIVAFVIVLGGGFLLIQFLRKKEKESFDEEDLFETETKNDSEEFSEFSQYDEFSSSSESFTDY